jgi:hypothetical protein
MALIIKDRVKVTSGSTGTGTFTLGAAVLGFQDFVAIGSGNATYYTIALQSGNEWEVGIGTVTDAGGGVYTLSRDTILESSNAGSAVNFSAGTKDVFVTYPAERAVYLNAAGSAVDVLDIGTVGVGTANITTANITAGTVATTPVNATDIANKQYVDDLVVSGVHFHEPVRVETTGNLTATYNNGTSGVGATLTNSGAQVALVIDGVTVSVNDRVLVYLQTAQTQNGIYVVSNTGSGSTNWVLTRATDADSYGLASPNELGEGSAVFVQQGNTGAGETYVCNTAGVITFGTTNITFAQVSSAQIYSAGTGLTLTNTTFSLTNTGTAGTYGTASQVPVFTTNAQGQVTGVTNTNIAIASSAVSGLAASATTDTTNAANITSGTLNTARINGAYTGITGVGTLTAGTWNATTIAPNYGGTGITSYTVGDLLFANGSASLTKLAGVATGNVLLSGGVGTAPLYGKVGLTTHVSGTLPIGNGGTGQTTADAALNALLPSQTSQTGKFLTTNGTSTSWGTVTPPNNGTLTMGVSGTGLTGSATFTADQAGNSTFTVTSNATSANTNSTIVARDGSGNFSAGTITAALSGNATTATTATNATNVTVTTSSTSSAFKVPFANTTASTTGNYGLLQDSAAEFTYNPSTNTLTVGTVAGALSGNATTATTLQTARNIGGVSFNGSADINLPGVNTAGNQNTSGNATTATTLQTARTINGTSFNGSANITITANTPNSVTFNNGGAGAASGTTFNGGSAITVSYNTVGAPSTTGTNASGTWGINISGNATTATSATSATSATTATTATNANNVAIAADTSSTGSFFVPYVSATTGNVAMRGTRLTVQPSTGNFTAVGTVTANSDERIKTDWSALPQDFIERLTKVKVGTYTRIDTGVRQAGSSAQDWQKLLPEVVSTGQDEQGTLSLAYGNAALVSVVELAKVVVDLKAEVESLKAKLKD